MNTFGDSQQQFALCDARSIFSNRQRFRREALPLLQRANHFYCPAGRWPFCGWVLLPRSDYSKLNTYSTTLKLNIGDTTKANNVSTLSNLAIVQAQCVTRGLASDVDAMYLVELTDARGILYNEWFRWPASAEYNVRSPAYPGLFYSGSLSAGNAWTWSGMLQDMWTKMTPLGSWPGLPATPTGTPEGFWFSSVPGWSNLCDILDYLGMTVACDLTKASPYTIVNAGATDQTFLSLQTTYATNLEDDLEWIDTGAGRVPVSVDVVFRRRNEYYGSEETVRRDSLQWFSTPYYTVTVAAPAEFSAATGRHSIWSDFTVRYDQDGNPVAADVTTANSIATERVNQYFAKIYRQTLGYMSQVYSGALPFATGSQVDGVCWWLDNASGKYQSWKTQVLRGPQPPWPKLEVYY